MLPLVLGLCIFYQNKSFHLRDYNRLLPLLCLALFLGVWTHANRAGLAVESGERLGHYAQNMFFYLKQALMPVDLALFHPFYQSGGYNVGAQNSFLPFLFFLPFYILIAINHRKTWARGLLLGLTAYLFLCAYGITARGTFVDGSPAHENHFQYLSLPILVALVVCSFGGLAHHMGSAGKVLWSLAFTVFIVLQLAITASYAYTVSDRAQMWYHLSEQWPEAWLPKLALIHTLESSEESSEEDSPLMTQREIIKTLEDILNQQPDLIAERKRLARIYRQEGQNTNALRQYRRILRDTSPGRAFLLETAEFYDTLGLSWDASNVRERIAE
jgi:tetratricopeptide (TPR) repeat protein